MTALRGRERETAAVERVVAAARAGHSAVLLLRGEAGIGKTALIDHAAGLADGMTVLTLAGVESEAEFPFAGLYGLLAAHLDRVARLPERQREAVDGALGTGRSTTVDRFLVGVGLLGVLSDLADEAPVLVLVDDVQWLDRASSDALFFAARRLCAESVALIAAVRDPHAVTGHGPVVDGLDEVVLLGLDDDAAAGVLAERGEHLSLARRERLIAEARGNPLALLALPVDTPADVGVPPPLAPAVGRESSAGAQRVRDVFARSIRALPEPTGTLLLAAAADDTGDAGVVLAAAARLGATVEDLVPAEDAELVRMSAQEITFRHPLIRSATYREAAATRRLAVHRALAAVYAERGDAARGAWHRAAATTQPDEEVASALSASAEAARFRGGSSAVAAAYARAATLSPDHERSGARLAAAALAALDAADRERAGEYAARADFLVRDRVAHATVVRVQATLAAERNRHAEAHRLLLRAATDVRDEAPRLAGDLLFGAVDAAWAAHDVAAARQAEAMAAGLCAPHGRRAGNLARVAVGMMVPSEESLVDVVDALRALVAQDAARDESADRDDRDEALAARWLLVLGDHVTAHTRVAALERHCRDVGAVGLLPRVLATLAICEQHRGRPHQAAATGADGLRIAEDADQNESFGHLCDILAHLAAINGDEERCTALLARAQSRTMPSAYPARAAAALALLDIGLGRFQSAYDRLAAVVPASGPLDVIGNVPDLVEVAARLERPQVAQEPAAWFAAWARAGGQPWAEAVAHRCAALLDQDDAEPHFRQALDCHESDGERPFERARSELLYGEWLRRARRRGEARTHLRSARVTFERLGASPWARRAAEELRAAGDSTPVTPGDQDADRLADLTPQEFQVVRLAAEGMSNREIATQLFLSSRTIGYHLYNAFPKLGISSRSELGRVLSSVDARPPEPTRVD